MAETATLTAKISAVRAEPCLLPDPMQFFKEFLIYELKSDGHVGKLRTDEKITSVLIRPFPFCVVNSVTCQNYFCLENNKCSFHELLPLQV